MSAPAVDAYTQNFSRSVSEVVADLESYAALLRKWQTVQNLVSRETLDSVWTRHFADSLQILPLLGQTDQNLLDLGSGGGLPALPLAIASKGLPRRFHLIEPNSRKVSFLRAVGRDLDLNVHVYGVRSRDVTLEDLPSIDVITSRALAPLPLLCTWMAPFFGPSTRAILHKGREHVEELQQAATQWSFDVVITKSDTDVGGVLLTITNLRAKSVR